MVIFAPSVSRARACDSAEFAGRRSSTDSHLARVSRSLYGFRVEVLVIQHTARVRADYREKGSSFGVGRGRRTTLKAARGAMTCVSVQRLLKRRNIYS